MTPGVVKAQDAPPCALGGRLIFDGIENKVNAPFTASVKVSFEQKLAGGNVIRGSALSQAARDSAGTTRSEMITGCVTDADDKLVPSIRITVYNPQTRTSMYWQTSDNSSMKIIDVYQQPQPPQVLPQITAEETAARKERQRAIAQQQPQSKVHTEDLGSKTIDGVVVQGRRTIRTYPAGAIGNALPYEEMDETWLSNELGIAIVRITDDPISGRRTVAYENLTRTEPIPALFEAPKDYKVRQLKPSVSVAVQ